jgi:hypothetical protein
MKKCLENLETGENREEVGTQKNGYGVSPLTTETIDLTQNSRPFPSDTISLFPTT